MCRRLTPASTYVASLATLRTILTACPCEIKPDGAGVNVTKVTLNVGRIKRIGSPLWLAISLDEAKEIAAEYGQIQADSQSIFVLYLERDYESEAS